MKSEFQDKTILVTGGTGSIGSELVKQVLTYDPKSVRIFSRDETKQYELMESLGYPDNVLPLIGDIRDQERLNFAFNDVDIVLHAAAMKHVSIGEYNPFEVVKTNIVGSQNVIDAAILKGVKKVVGISTDKAVNPTSVLGVSKLMMEKLFVNANHYIKKSNTKFSCVRFGNIAWSRGSVFPSWQRQAEKERRIYVTDGDMTRFFISKEQAIDLVLQAVMHTQGGEIFVLKMSSIGLQDLAKMFIEKYFGGQDIEIIMTGQRAGEKTHEQLIDTADQYEKIYHDGKLYILIPRMKLKDVQGFVTDTPTYPGFEALGDIETSSSQDMIDIDLISDII